MGKYSYVGKNTWAAWLLLLAWVRIMVFVYRLNRQLAVLKACPVTAKFGGATGNYNAHHVAYPEYDWKAFGNQFVAEKLGLEREEYTTQISNYDNLGAIFDAMKRINTIMIDMNRDFGSTSLWSTSNRRLKRAKSVPALCRTK